MKYQTIEKLPTDRAFLHFEAKRNHESEMQVDYELIIPLGEVDCRGTFDNKGKKNRPKSHRAVWLDVNNNRRIPLGRTMIGVGATNDNHPLSRFGADEIELPFRDGAHAQWDNERLGGLELIYTRGNEHWLLIREPKEPA